MSRLNSFLLAFNAICFLVILSILLPSCGGGGQPNSGSPAIDPSTVKIPAANILFRPLNAAQTRDDGVNTDIKIYADQVQLDNSNTSLQATNVQGAFEETQPDLATILPGTWTTSKTLWHLQTNTEYTGTVTFNSDGTVNCDDGGKIFLSGGFKGSTVEITGYSVTDDDAIMVNVKITSPDGSSNTINNPIVFRSVKSTSLKIVDGSGKAIKSNT